MGLPGNPALSENRVSEDLLQALETSARRCTRDACPLVSRVISVTCGATPTAGAPCDGLSLLAFDRTNMPRRKAAFNQWVQCNPMVDNSLAPPVAAHRLIQGHGPFFCGIFDAKFACTLLVHFGHTGTYHHNRLMHNTSVLSTVISFIRLSRNTTTVYYSQCTIVKFDCTK